MLNLLQELKEKLGLTYFFISHNLNVVYQVSDRVGVMYLGNMVEIASYDQLYEKRYHPYTEALLSAIRRIFKGRKGGQLGMGLLVCAMDIATANNTVAIVMANPIAKEMAQEYGVSPRKTASLLDTFSCISQGAIPYGAQMLVAISAASELGFEVTAFDIIPYLFYPGLLLVSSLVFIFLLPQKDYGKMGFNK